MDIIEEETYRGYSLRLVGEHQHVHIHHGMSYISAAPDMVEAKKVIDSWLDAR